MLVRLFDSSAPIATGRCQIATKYRCRGVVSTTTASLIFPLNLRSLPAMVDVVGLAGRLRANPNGVS
jgi:hypothetical protein